MCLVDYSLDYHCPNHTDQEEVPIAQTCYLLGTEPIASLSGGELHTHGSAMVFLNGALLGVHRRPHSLVRAIRWTGSL